MKIIISAILITIVIGICCDIVIKGIDRHLSNSLDKQIKLNNQLLGLYQSEKDKVDTLYKIIFHIRQQLSLLKLKNCPEKEFKNIPFEIINWIDMLEKVNNGEDNGIQK